MGLQPPIRRMARGQMPTPHSTVQCASKVVYQTKGETFDGSIKNFKKPWASTAPVLAHQEVWHNRKTYSHLAAGPATARGAYVEVDSGA